MLPKKRSASVATNKIDIGALVDFEHSGKPLLGVVQGEKKGKWTVLSQTGRALDLPADRLFLLHSQLPAELTTTSQQTAHLSTLATDSEAAAKTLDLEPLWELVSEEGKDFEIYELHELLNPKGKALELLTLRRALSHDRVFFKRKKFLFAPRPVEVVKDLKRQRAIETEKRVAREALVEALVERIAKKSTEPLPDLISIVEELATLGNASPHAKDALEVIELLGSRLKMEFHGRPEDRAFKLLVRASYFSPDENMSLRRLSRSVRFSDEVLDAAEEIINRFDPSELTDVEDARDVLAITIDGADTRDMDDAVSLEVLEEGFRVGVHITNVAESVPTSSPVFQEAMRRGTSIYFPETHIPMIPTSLSEKKLSLVAGADRASLSFFVELDNKLNITSRRIARTTICIDDRLSYEDADSVLYEDTEQQRIERQDVKQMLERLWNVAVHLEQQRLEQGAFSFNRKELYPQIDTQGRVSLQEVEEESPSRKLVGELMILANETAALFAAEHNLPLIFRAQLPPDVNLDQQGLDIPPGPARDFARRGFIKRSETGTTAAAHAGLGLKAYSQVTSPMRRMTDLINQRQLIAKLRGETLPYSHSSLGELLEELQQPLDEAGNLQRERNKYWLLKYIKQEKLETLTGTVVRLDGPKPLAHVDIMFYAMPFHVREGVQDRSKAYELGQEIELHIDQVDPRKEILRLRDRG